MGSGENQLVNARWQALFPGAAPTFVSSKLLAVQDHQAVAIWAKQAEVEFGRINVGNGVEDVGNGRFRKRKLPTFSAS
ncbi:MAG: hypothetical protein IPJ90_11880 [Anaerolineaceae bacterium]|nr:hypothetical protein [Anaerolineaceae bacterium]